MCGILAAVSYHGKIPENRLAAGMNALAHRGPDGEGARILALTNGGEVALAHRRLSIFDLSNAGAQPMADERGRLITFNGSIFNWPELRRELEGCGYRFSTQTDTEVILAAFDKWGPDCVTRFNGFWAFAILDKARETAPATLFLSRDRFGIKPLYYTADGYSAVFASEIGAINAFRNSNPEPDIEELTRQLVYQLGDDSERTIYRNIFELEPATNLLVDLRNGETRHWKYWSLAHTPFEGDDAAALDRFTELFEDAVRIRLRADREVALTLSGGIDSSAIAVAASRVSDAKVRAFTSHFPGRADLDETHYAKVVAQKFGLEHILVEPDLANISAEEKRLTRHQEVMYKSFSLLVNWSVIHKIQQTGVRIFLTGQGGDELFLGYERYYASYLKSLLKTSPASSPRELIAIGQNSRLGVWGAVKFLLYFSNNKIRTARYRQEAGGVYNPRLVAAARGAAAQLPSDLSELQDKEICGSQLRHLLRYDDRTSAAFGTEGRPAFLDHRLVEFAASLDWRFKIRNGWTKYILRLYLDRAGLPEIAWRKHKFGYEAPTLAWTNALLSEFGDLSAFPRAGHLLQPGLKADAIPERMRFPVYNLLSTAREMHWAV